MPGTRPLLALLAASAIGVSPYATAQAATTTVKHWTITASAVGPLHLGEPLSDLKKAGFALNGPCGPEAHPCYFKGKLGQDMAFDVNAHSKVKEMMVHVASGAGYAFATKHGTRVGSTISALKLKEHPTYIGNYGYGFAFQTHPAGTRKWITFFALGKNPTAKVYSIVVSSYPKPIQGR